MTNTATQQRETERESRTLADYTDRRRQDRHTDGTDRERGERHLDRQTLRQTETLNE